MTHNLWYLLGFIGLVALRYPARLAFNRRNENGVQQFSSYGHMVRSRWIGRLLRVGGLAVIIVALQHGCVSRRSLPSHQAAVSRNVG